MQMQMLRINYANSFKKINNNFYSNVYKYFTGKTETGWKFTTPIIKMKSVKPIYPAPGDNIQIPGKYFDKNTFKI